MLGQYRGDVVTEERGVVEVLDIGAVDTEDVIDTTRRQIPDDVIDNTMSACHSSPAFASYLQTRLATELGSTRQPIHR